jgi:hypothetical protein
MSTSAESYTEEPASEAQSTLRTLPTVLSCTTPPSGALLAVRERVCEEATKLSSGLQSLQTAQSLQKTQPTTRPITAPKQSSYKLSKRELEGETSDEVRNLLRYELNAAALHFLGQDIPMYFEGLGILFPETRTEYRSENKREHLKVWRETYRTALFEKCLELTTYHRERFPKIVETKEIAQWIYPRLPHFMTAQWEDRAIRRFLRGTIDGIRQEVVMRGYSREISSLGELFSLHNRQGDTFTEWFAGSDIFLRATYRHTLTATKPELFQRPLLKNAWGLLEAAFGPPREISTIPIPKELAALGYDPTLLPSDQQDHLKVAAFRAGEQEDERGSWVFCTEGLRKLGLSSPKSKGFGNELVFQLSDSGFEHVVSNTTTPPFHLAARPLVVGWMLLQSARSNTIKVGSGLAVDVPLFPEDLVGGTKKGLRRGTSARVPMKMILAAPFAKVRSEQLSEDGPFSYINIVAITEDESEFASRAKSETLLALLEHRRLTQISSPARSSLLFRTYNELGIHKAPPAAHDTQSATTAGEATESETSSPEALAS